VGWLIPAGRAVGTALRDPAIVILLLAGVADLLAGDPLVDGLVLLAVAAALGWDRARGRRQPLGRRTPALVVGGLLYAVAAGGLARFSWPAMVAVAVPGLLGVVSAWRAAPGPPAEAAPPLGRGRRRGRRSSSPWASGS
jgi:hypothetical protein